MAGWVMSTVCDVTHHPGVREAAEAAVAGNGGQRGIFKKVFFPLAVGGVFAVGGAPSYQLCGQPVNKTPAGDKKGPNKGGTQ